MKKQTSNIRDLCLVSLFTAVIAIMAQIAIPMPIGVPMTMQTFAISLAGIVLGAKKGALSSIIYMLLGAIGLPVFANFSGGWQTLLGPTGGFILSFPLMAYIIGWGYEHTGIWKRSAVLGNILGNIINLLCGILMFCFLTKCNLLIGFLTCGLPFIPVTIIKTILASMLGNNIRKRLRRTTYVN